MLVAYLPKEKVLLEADGYNPQAATATPPNPPSPYTVEPPRQHSAPEARRAAHRSRSLSGRQPRGDDGGAQEVGGQDRRDALMIRGDVLQQFPDLFGARTINGRTVDVNETIAALTTELRPEDRRRADGAAVDPAVAGTRSREIRVARVGRRVRRSRDRPALDLPGDRPRPDRQLPRPRHQLCAGGSTTRSRFLRTRIPRGIRVSSSPVRGTRWTWRSTR